MAYPARCWPAIVLVKIAWNAGIGEYEQAHIRVDHGQVATLPIGWFAPLVSPAFAFIDTTTRPSLGTPSTREFLAAAREAAAAVDGSRRDEFLAHLDSAERRLAAADPIRNPDRLLPQIREPKPEDLKPYLDGWSP